MYIHRLAEPVLEKLLQDRKVLLVLGARQVGKTTLLHQLLASQNTLFLNLDVQVDVARLQAAASLSPAEGLRSLGNPDTLVIDEAQQLPQVGQIVKGWYDQKVACRIILLGSSSLNLLDQTAESLTGRNRKLQLTPLLLEEVLATQPWYSEGLPTEVLYEQFAGQLSTLLLQTLVYGSYPETLSTSDREGYLLDLVSDYLLKDVLQSELIRSPTLIKRLLLLLARQPGSQVSVNGLAQELEVSRLTIDRYLELLERTYVIFRLPPYSTSLRAEISRSYKIYFWDTGVRNALLKEFALSPFRSDLELLFENWAVAEVAKYNLLRGSRHELYFWRTSDGASVDLLVKGGGRLSAYDIRWDQRQSASGRSFTQQYGTPVLSLTPDRPLLASCLEEPMMTA